MLGYHHRPTLGFSSSPSWEGTGHVGAKVKVPCWLLARVEGFKSNLNPRAASPASWHMLRLPCWTAVDPEPASAALVDCWSFSAPVMSCRLLKDGSCVIYIII